MMMTVGVLKSWGIPCSPDQPPHHVLSPRKRGGRARESIKAFNNIFADSDKARIGKNSKLTIIWQFQVEKPHRITGG